MREGESPLGYQLKNWDPLMEWLLISLNNNIKTLRDGFLAYRQ